MHKGPHWKYFQGFRILSALSFGLGNTPGRHIQTPNVPVFKKIWCFCQLRIISCRHFLPIRKFRWANMAHSYWVSVFVHTRFLLAMRESLDLLPNKTPCISISFPAVSSASVWFLGFTLRKYDAAFVVAFLCPFTAVQFRAWSTLWFRRTIGEIPSCRCFWNFVLSPSVTLSLCQ